MRLLDLSPLRVGEGASAQAGLSVLRGEDWIHGNEALAACRIDPQSTCADVWLKLSRDPVLGAESRAWLAVGQLKARVSNKAGVWAALTPDTWAKPALQIFLGVARECGLDVRLLLSRATAVAALTATGDVCTVLEWGWTSLRAIRVVRDTEGWRFEDSRLLADGGVFDFYRRDARIAADLALAKTRVDLLDSGVRDQALFNAWWAWRMHGEPWKFTLEGLEFDFTGELERFRAPYVGWLEARQVPDQAEVVMPGPLREMVMARNALVEPTSFLGVLARLEEPAQPGARWKASIPAAAPSPTSTAQTAPLPVTHLVVNGIATRCPPEQSAALVPGRSLVLPDGRPALAIHVPEN